MKESVGCLPTNGVSFQMLSNNICQENNLSSCSGPQPAFRKHPSKLFVETTTRCNFKCQACVKQSSGNGIVDGDMSLATFMALVPVFPYLENMVLSGIGEPLLHPRLEEFIGIAKKTMPHGSWVGFQSNGALLTKTRAISLISAGLDRICLSLDSVAGDTFRTLREGGEVTDIEQALSILGSAKDLCGKAEFEIGIEFVLRRDNVHELVDVLKWATDRGATFAIVTHLLPYESSHVSQISYEYNSDDALALYEPWKRMADSEGIDISKYFDILFSFRIFRTQEEQRILDHVRHMMLESNQRGIFLRVKNILERDETLFEEMTRIFDEAKGVAESTGLSLRLPEILPTANRKCDFVEGGSAMVSWDGSVHPCYYLWHNYDCYYRERDLHKHIEAKYFGNTEHNSIESIWNTQKFILFRKEVLKYEFSYCTNCNVSPCNLIDTSEFSNDCHTNTVPCGDCFWCMGMFNCMQ
ncbi:MAG: radical SAM/SPASM family putative metalloenzyme maturase [Desulfuromonadales bacterium]|nr:radical SAM/SPASM family putative metalloenzyme maturase [Desulfuromonadales bacterium]